MIHTVIFIGKFASGKSRAFKTFQELYPDHIALSDRNELAVAVRRDTHGISSNHKAMIVGMRSMILGSRDVSNEKLRMRVLKPSILNEVHDDMLGSLVDPPTGKRMRLVEIATGPDIPLNGEVLRQNTLHVFWALRGMPTRRETMVIEIDAPFQTRFARNIAREREETDGTGGTKVDEAAFQQFSPDGGEGNMALAFLCGINYRRIDNGRDDIKWFDNEVRNIVQCIDPEIGGSRGLERKK
jgi:hypothetical protein